MQLTPEQQVSLGITNYLLNNGYEVPQGMTVPELKNKVLDLALKIKSHQSQDILVQLLLNFKENGYFVEFGATDGIVWNNTFVLEKEYNWTGILAEPAKIWYNSLSANRSAKIDNRCVWEVSNQLIQFDEVRDPFMSTTEGVLTNSPLVETYSVPTVSLLDLLKEHGAPQTIDYLSIDTKGTEFTILKDFDFTKYDIKIITCNHQFLPTRSAIYALMIANGFVRICNEISWVDDWYVKPEIAKGLKSTDNLLFDSQYAPDFKVMNLLVDSNATFI